ncbi:spore germination protein [Clostridium swellfunianum]|uniref:GerAB/ArcD/ProY family transporter n=1 Tax=Clostridium swellfunianum TaxID=1367462 RepID=UPI00202EFE13|nr:GerAB/ArcD/ProY family transporter [Clostridium swellfunianum]MCM0650727.1 spore germination protein [Clostridium swellfunianum]
MNDSRHDITSTQLMALLVSAEIGAGIVTLPSILAQKVGHDGWISIIITGFLCIAVGLIIMNLLKSYSDKTIFQINDIIYGKILGFILNFSFLLYLVFIAGMTLRVFMEIVNIIVLKLTPPLVITVIISISTVYGVAKGLKVIARFSVMLYFSYFIMILTLLMAIKYTRYTYLLPVGYAGLSNIANGVKISAYSFLGFELVAVIYPNIKNKDKAATYMCLSIAITTLYYVMAVVVTTAMFGETKLAMLVFPIYNLEQSLNIPVIERFDIFYIMFWFPTIASSVRAYFFSAYYGITKVFKIRMKKLLIFALAVAVIAISRVPRNFEAMYDYLKFGGNLGIFLIFIINITFLISFVKRRWLI